MMSETAESYLKAARLGDVEAQYNLALIYYNGDGVPQNDTEAASWLLAAAEHGHLEAQHQLAGMYMSGRSVSKDYTEAAKWYRQAAELGHAPSQNNMGELYFTGEGVPQNKFYAEMWFQEALAQGNANAETALEILADNTDALSIDSAEKLADAIDHMSDKRKHVFREIIMANPHVSKDVYSAFFKLNNRIGGGNKHIFVSHITYRSGLEKDEVIEQCYDLRNQALIKEKLLTDWAFCIEEPIISLVNQNHELILKRLYTPAERNSFIPEFLGGASLDKEEQPYSFYDADDIPLNGKFRFIDSIFMKDGVYEFKDGKPLS